MKYIRTSKNKNVIVDDEDYDFLTQHSWNHSGSGEYVMTFFRDEFSYLGYGKGRGKKMVYLHRFLMKEPVGMYVDHINHNILDNRKENLRVCSSLQSSRNRRMYANNKSGFKGVIETRNNNPKRPWRAQINIGKRVIFLGNFESKLEAAKSYNKASLKYHGEFSYINKI